MNKTEILKSFLEDEIIKEKYGFSDSDIENINFVTPNAKPIVELLRRFVEVVENDNPIRTAASNLHTFLENQLRQR